MVLGIFQPWVNPIQTEKIQCVTGNAAALFGIDDVINFSFGNSQLVHLLQHVYGNLKIIAVDVALHLLEFAGRTGLEIREQ